MGTEMDALRLRIEALMRERGRSARSLSLAIGQNPAYIQQLITGMRNKKPPSIEVMESIAEELGVSLAELRGMAVREVRAPLPIRRLTEAELFERFGIKPYDQPLSVEGVALSAGTGAGVPQGIDDTITRRVPGRRYLWEAPVVGDCMEDEIHPGEVVIYSTRLGAELNKIMVALRDEEELLIKRLVVHNGAQILRPIAAEEAVMRPRGLS